MEQLKLSRISDAISEFNGGYIVETTVPGYEMNKCTFCLYNKDREVQLPYEESKCSHFKYSNDKDSCKMSYIGIMRKPIDTMPNVVKKVFINEFSFMFSGKDYKDIDISKDLLSEDQYNELVYKLSNSKSDIPSEIGLTDDEFTLIAIIVLLFKFMGGYSNRSDEEYKIPSEDLYNMIRSVTIV